MPLALLDKTWRNLYYPPEKKQYTYFDLKSTHPFAGAASDVYVKASWAADAAMLAYGRWGQARMPDAEFAGVLKDAGLPDLRPVGAWTAGAQGTQGYFASNDQFAILAFRGTERDDPKDSISDVVALLVDEQDYSSGAGEPQKALRHLAFIEDLFHPQPCRVHQGFQSALNEVWLNVHQCISEYRAKHPQSEICFTGHSLGAALATLAASRFGGGKASLYTFGCPRVGTAAFYDRVCRNADLGTFRFVNGNDPVTHVPVQDPWYCHPKLPCFHIDPNGAIRLRDDPPTGDWTVLAEAVRALPSAGAFYQLDSPAPLDLVDHSPSQYCIHLRNYVTARG